jgi:GDPmannose 4,6-dehydratase
MGSKEKLELGNLRIRRDWGWAPEYVDAMWRMLQQDQGGDFVIATGESHSLEEFVCQTFSELGLRWHDHVEVSDSLMRPTDISEGRGDATKAERDLHWSPRMKMRDVISEMIRVELAFTRSGPKQ